MNTYVGVQYDMYKCNNELKPFFNPPMFDKLYKLFKKLHCKKCFEEGKLPKWVTFDGVGHVIKARHIKK